MVEEARLEEVGSGLVPTADGWFVVNVRDAAWETNDALGAMWQLGRWAKISAGSRPFARHAPSWCAPLRGERERAADDEWHSRMEQATARLDELAAAYAEDKITKREWLAARDPLQRQLDTARRRVSRDSRAAVFAEHAGHGDALRKRWGDLSLDRRRAIIAAVLSHVVAVPGRRGYNRFDPNRFAPVWRQ